MIIINTLRLAENIGKLRREKKVTQDELATFLKITKASVSKWETGQSYPDILLLPQIASYFDITIDELLGYEPQLSSEQIRKYYMDLAEDFSKLPFDEVIQKSRALVKKYYSCYPFLNQIVLLWINHFMISGDKDKEVEVLNSIVELCDHIIKNSSNVGMYEDIISFRAIANLYLGKVEEVIEELEPLLKKKQLTAQYEPILIQAYQSRGEISKAELHSQITIYKDLMNLISNSMAMINFKMKDREFCEETIKRIRNVIETYDIKNLHPNTALQFSYQEAIFYSVHGYKEKALKILKEFVYESLKFIEKGVFLHGDNYFNRLEEWFEEFTLKTEAPRRGKVIIESLVPALENPALELLFDEEEYKELKKKIEKRKEGK